MMEDILLLCVVAIVAFTFVFSCLYFYSAMDETLEDLSKLWDENAK